MKAVAFQCIYCISHELSAANKDLSLNKYLQHQHWDLSWQVKFPSKSLAIAQQIPEGRNLGILAEPIVTREGKHSRERAFMKRMHVLLFTGIGILCEVTRTLSRQYWACLGFFFLPPPPPPLQKEGTERFWRQTVHYHLKGITRLQYCLIQTSAQALPQQRVHSSALDHKAEIWDLEGSSSQKCTHLNFCNQHEEEESAETHSELSLRTWDCGKREAGTI